jgi:hypothetical protein
MLYLITVKIEERADTKFIPQRAQHSEDGAESSPKSHQSSVAIRLHTRS